MLDLLGHISDEDISDTAFRRGIDRIRDSLLQRGMKVNYEGVLWFVSQILGQYNGWFRCDLNKADSRDFLHLSHNYGYKWSIFVMNYVNSILKDVLGFKTNTIISNNSVNIEIIKRP